MTPIGATTPDSMPRWAQWTLLGTGTALAFLWGFAEGTLFFILPDVMLSFVALYRPRRALWHMLAMLTGAVLGGSVMYVWATHGQEARHAVAGVPAVSPEMFERAERDWERYGLSGMSLGPVRGIPYKVYAVEAPAKSTLLDFALLSIPARLWRFVVVWLGFAGAGLLLRKMRRASLAPLLHAVYWTTV
jgi:membrane protein YqaA with SNARE-associated domain